MQDSLLAAKQLMKSLFERCQLAIYVNIWMQILGSQLKQKDQLYLRSFGNVRLTVFYVVEHQNQLALDPSKASLTAWAYLLLVVLKALCFCFAIGRQYRSIIPRLPNSHDNQQDHLKPKVLWGWLLEPSCLRKPSCLVDVQKDHCEYHEDDTRRGYVLEVRHHLRLSLATISNNHMSPECLCGNSKLMSVKELIGRHSPVVYNKDSFLRLRLVCRF